MKKQVLAVMVMMIINMYAMHVQIVVDEESDLSVFRRIYVDHHSGADSFEGYELSTFDLVHTLEEPPLVTTERNEEIIVALYKFCSIGEVGKEAFVAEYMRLHGCTWWKFWQDKKRHRVNGAVIYDKWRSLEDRIDDFYNTDDYAWVMPYNNYH